MPRAHQTKITIVGKGLPADILKNLLAKSYDKNPSDYKDFSVDKDLSGQRVQVYKNHKTGQVVVAHRGTQGIHDWITDLRYGLGDTSGDRFKHSKKIQDAAEEKYGAENVTTIGHSLGSQLAEKAGGNSKEIITLNKPVSPYDLLFGKKVADNQTDVKTSYDPVSFLRGFQGGNKAQVLDSETSNPLTEHSTQTLGRIDDNQNVGLGIVSLAKLKSPVNNMVVKRIGGPESLYHPAQMSTPMNMVYHPNAASGIHHHYHFSDNGAGLYGGGMWDWADPNKNGVAKAFSPGGSAQQFGEQIGQKLRDNIRPIIHTGVGTAISGLTGIPMSGALAGQLGLNGAIDQGLDKANLGFGLGGRLSRATSIARRVKRWKRGGARGLGLQGCGGGDDDDVYRKEDELKRYSQMTPKERKEEDARIKRRNDFEDNHAKSGKSMDQATMGGKGVKKGRFVKGSPEAKKFMADLRAKRGSKGGAIPGPHSRSYFTDASML